MTISLKMPILLISAITSFIPSTPFPLRPVFGQLNPNGVAAGVIEDHLVPVASAGCMWEFTSLVRIDCVTGVIHLDRDVLVCV